MPYLIHTAHWHIDALFCVLKPFSTSIAPAGRFRDLVVKVPNPRYVWFAWNLADRNNYMQWLFAKARRKKASSTQLEELRWRDCRNDGDT